MNERMQKLIWTLKQLLPLHYDSRYTEAGQRHHVTWRMWFGRCFDIRDEITS